MLRKYSIKKIVKLALMHYNYSNTFVNCNYFNKAFN